MQIYIDLYVENSGLYVFATPECHRDGKKLLHGGEEGAFSNPAAAGLLCPRMDYRSIQ